MPRVVGPSLKVTLPVGVPAPGATALTFAVKVTDCPTIAGFFDDVSVVAVDAAFTVSPPPNVPELPVKVVVFGTYVAVTECGDPVTVRIDVA